MIDILFTLVKDLNTILKFAEDTVYRVLQQGSDDGERHYIPPDPGKVTGK
ncbi:MAG: hypothetical protein ACOVRN_10720 [Flavobacterium sp.]